METAYKIKSYSKCFSNFIHFLFVCLLLEVSNAQTYELTRYADDNGLPSRIVRDVIQGKEGFIWVAGNNGLYRFDGKDFRPYLSALKDTIGLRNNQINTILQDSNSKIWIGTPQGLHVLEGDTVRYTPLKDGATREEEHILDLFEDQHQNIWVSTYKGVFFLENSTAPLSFLTGDGDGAVTEGAIWSVTEDVLGRIWVATSDGPYLRNKNDPFTFDKVTISKKPGIEEKEIGYYRFQHYQGNLYITDTSIGLLKGEFKNDTLHLTKFKDVSGKELPQFAVDKTIIDQNRDIWVGTSKLGLKKYKWQQGRLRELEIISRNGFFEMSGDVRSVYQDKQNNLWIANSNGLYKLSEYQGNSAVFPPRYYNDCLDDLYGIYAILEDKGGYLWITTSTTLYRFKKEDVLSGNCPKDYFRYQDPHMQLSRNLFIDSGNRLWIGADGGLFVTQLDEDQNPGKFVRYTTADGLPHNWSYDIYEIDPNTFWVGNYSGLLKLELKNGELNSPNIQIFESDKKRRESLVNSMSTDIEKDANGRYWIGTFSGVSKLIDGSGPGRFTNYTNTGGDFSSISNNSIKKIFKDSKDQLWVATQRGLNYHDDDKGDFVQLGHGEGLPSEYILGIQEDSKGFLWIGTTNGVLKAKYDRKKGLFVEKTHFTSQNGLIDNIPYRNSIYIDSEDNVFVGSRDGISIFKEGLPPRFDNSGFNMKLTDLETIGRKTQGFKSIRHLLQKDETLTLAHSQNSIHLKYAALDFSNPAFNKYRHKFLPSNAKWIETGNNSELTYYNLPPGNYELILDGANSKGQWSKKPIRLQLSIRPPIWRSIWAYMAYLVILTGLIFALYWMRIKKKERELRQKMALETAIIQEREELRKENAADFHDELGAMVTKISMFLTMAERSWDNKEDPTPFLHKIRNNAKGLSTGFRDLLWVIDPQKDSLADTFMRLKEFGEDMFEQSSFDFRTSIFKEEFAQRILSPKTKKQVMMIFKEAMTNCMKYSGGDLAELLVSTSGEFSTMVFRDNGRGFNLAHKSKGRGLKNIKNRADKIEVELYIESDDNGTVIRLERIPHMGDTFSKKDK